MSANAAPKTTNAGDAVRPFPAPRLRIPLHRRNWMPRVIGQSWRSRVRALTWSILGTGVQQDTPDLLLAVARAFLAITSLVAIWLDRTQPTWLATSARSLLLIYVAYSAAIFIFERMASRSAHYAALIHVGDIAWAVAITSLTEGPNSPFFLFFLFALIAAAYRWDMRRVMLTAASLFALLVMRAGLLHIPAVSNFLGYSYETDRFILRAAYLLAASIVIGYVGDNEKRHIKEAAFAGSLVAIPRAELGLKGSARMVLREIVRFFRAHRAAMLIRIKDGDTYFLELGNRSADCGWVDLSPEKAEPWLFNIPAECAWIVRTVSGSNLLDQPVRWRSRNSRGELELPLDWPECRGFRDLLFANFVGGEGWSGRIFLFDPQPPGDPISALDLMDRIVRQVTPAVHNVYLLRRIRERAQAVQRGRLAHELHDGAIQALVAARLQLEAFHRKHALPDGALAELRRTQEVLRSEIFNLRMIMQDLYARSLGQPDFAGNLIEIMDNFRRSTELKIELVWDPDSMKFRGRVALDALRIIQEALLNIHRHSGAKNAIVQLSNAGRELRITIEDDGAGLEFDGRLQLSDLDALRIGPRVIKQRLHELGGTLLIESHPGTGSRLEIAIPLVQHDQTSIVAD